MKHILVVFLVLLVGESRASGDLIHCTVSEKDPIYSQWLPKTFSFNLVSRKKVVFSSNGYTYNSAYVFGEPLEKLSISANKYIKASDGKTYNSWHTITIHKDMSLSYLFIIKDVLHRRAKGVCTVTTPAKYLFVNSGCSPNFPNICSDEEVCSKITYTTASGVRLFSNSRTKPLIEEAKKRSLNCGIGLPADDNEQTKKIVSDIKEPKSLNSLPSLSKPSTHQEFCKSIGYMPNTESFANCVLQMTLKEPATTEEANEISYERALYLCKQDARGARGSVNGNNIRCSGTYDSINCQQGVSGGGALAGFLSGLTESIVYKKTLSACMDSFGYTYDD